MSSENKDAVREREREREINKCSIKRVNMLSQNVHFIKSKVS